MSKFVELEVKEQEQINGGATDIIEAISDWIVHLLGLDDPDREPVFP